MMSASEGGGVLAGHSTAADTVPAAESDATRASHDEQQITSPTPPTLQPPKKVKRIPAAVAQMLQDHFKIKKYSQNSKMPGRNVDRELDNIIDKYGLERKQGSRQLARYRRNNFNNGLVVLALDHDEVFSAFLAFLFLETCLYKSWARRLVLNDTNENPSVTMPEEDLIGKYAEAIMYFVASWIVSRRQAATKVKGLEKRRAFQAFAMHHNLSASEASDDKKLPTSLVDLRERKSLFRASADLFAFMRKIESIYLANLNLPMMLQHADGSLLNVIKEAILTNEEIVSDFDDLCIRSTDEGDEEYIYGLESQSMRKELLEYVMTKFSRMRGQEFARTVRGQSTRYQTSHGNSTRVKVAISQAASTEAISREKDMEKRIRKEYQDIEKNICDMPDDAAIDEDPSNDSDDSSIGSDSEDE